MSCLVWLPPFKFTFCVMCQMEIEMSFNLVMLLNEQTSFILATYSWWIYELGLDLSLVLKHGYGLPNYLQLLLMVPKNISCSCKFYFCNSLLVNWSDSVDNFHNFVSLRLYYFPVLVSYCSLVNCYEARIWCSFIIYSFTVNLLIKKHNWGCGHCSSYPLLMKAGVNLMPF